MRLQTVALESGLSKAEPSTPFAFRDNPAETLFDKGFQSCPLLVGQLAGLLKEAIWYLYGCFHMANHIIIYPDVNGIFRNEEARTMPAMSEACPMSDWCSWECWAEC